MQAPLSTAIRSIISTPPLHTTHRMRQQDLWLSTCGFNFAGLDVRDCVQNKRIHVYCMEYWILRNEQQH